MTVQTVKLAGKNFVIVPEKDFRRLQKQASGAAAIDRDLAEHRRRMKEPGGKSLAQVRKELGL